MSGTTADKLNYLKDTKELLRQEINNDFIDLNLTESDPFRQYPSRMSSSQFWMDAWIGGSCKYNVSYDGTDGTMFNSRCFDTISMPNVTGGCSGIIANTLTIGGPERATDSIISPSCRVGTLYVNNTKYISASGYLTPVSNDFADNIYLPWVGSVAGNTWGWGQKTYAISGGNVYLPRVSNIDEYGIRYSVIHIGTELTFVCNLAKNGLANPGAIYVPASLVDAYKSAPYWSSFTDRIYAEPGT